MALSDKKYERMFSTTGSDGDKIDTATFNDIKEDFDENRYILDVGHFKMLGPVIYQIQLLTEELDALRSEISANKDKTGITTGQASAITANTSKASMVLGTTNKTALAGNTTTISTAQANAITANTAKTSMTLGTSGSTALAGDTNIVTIGSSTTIAFGDMITTPGKKGGASTYSIVMTVTNGGVSKSTTLTLT